MMVVDHSFFFVFVGRNGFFLHLFSAKILILNLIDILNIFK